MAEVKYLLSDAAMSTMPAYSPATCYADTDCANIINNPANIANTACGWKTPAPTTSAAEATDAGMCIPPAFCYSTSVAVGTGVTGTVAGTAGFNCDPLTQAVPAGLAAADSDEYSCDESSGCSENSKCATDYTDYCECCSGSGSSGGLGAACVTDTECAGDSSGATRCGTPTVDGVAAGPSSCVLPTLCNVDVAAAGASGGFSCGAAHLGYAALISGALALPKTKLRAL